MCTLISLFHVVFLFLKPPPLAFLFSCISPCVTSLLSPGPRLTLLLVLSLFVSVSAVFANHAVSFLKLIPVCIRSAQYNSYGLSLYGLEQNYISFPKVLLHQDYLAHIFHFGGCKNRDGSPLDFSSKRLKQLKKLVILLLSIGCYLIFFQMISIIKNIRVFQYLNIHTSCS